MNQMSSEPNVECTDQYSSDLSEYVSTQGVDVWGIADLTGLAIPHHPSAAGLLGSLSRAISIGIRIPSAVLDDIKTEPTLLYAQTYKAVNWVLDQTALRLSNRIQSHGYSAAPIPASQVVDWVNQQGHLSHRAVAQLAGVGSKGWSGLIVHPRYGARVRYATVLTNMPLSTDTPADPLCQSCSSCGKCVAMCPAHAIRPDRFNRDACIAQLKEFAKIQGVGKHICGLCVKACPGHID